MKLHKHITILLSALLLTSCGANPPVDSTSSSHTLGEQTVSIQYLGQEKPFGCGNSSGYYYLDTLDGGASLLRYVDYATRQDVPLCSQPNCTHNDEKCPAWFAYGGTTLNVYATDKQLLICFNGSPWDSSAFAEYGEAALPRVFTLELDGSARQEVARFDAPDAFSSMPAFDGQILYTIVTSYDEGDGYGSKAITAIDLATGKKKTDDSIQRRELRIVGAAGRELVLESMVSDTLTAYAAYNVDSGKLRDLYNESQQVSAVFRNGKLFLLEVDSGVLRCIDVATGAETTLSTDLLNSRSLDWVCLAFVTDTGYVVQAHENGTACNFLIDKSGKTTKQDLWADSTDSHDKMRMLNIFAQTDSGYLVSPSRTFHTVNVPGPEGVTYGVDQVKYAFALISPEDFWSSNPNYQPVSRLE